MRRPKADSPALHRIQCRGHAIRRARERFALTIGFDDIAEMEEQILAERWCRLGRNGVRALYLVVRRGMELPCVFDHQLGAMVTILADPSWFFKTGAE